MSKSRPALILILLLVGLAFAKAASAEPVVSDEGVENRFPESIVFKVSATSDTEIRQVRFRYTILPDGTSATALAEFQPGNSVSTAFTLEGNNPPKIYLPPGTAIQYRWEVTDSAGKTSSTQSKDFFYDDIRFKWKSVTAGGLTIYYYSGSDRDARAMQDVANRTMTEMTTLLGTKVEFPVKVWVYQSVSDMRPALSKRSSTYEQSIVTAGVRVSSDTVLVLGNASFDTLRHELTHVVTAAAGEGPFGDLPAWLDEGTAVYGQDDLGGFRQAIERGISRGSVLSVRSISSYPGDPSNVELFYGQSWSLVSFLNERFGAEKFALLFSTIKSGKSVDQALQAVYGFDQNGLEDQWRREQGLPVLERSTPNSSQGPQPALPSATAGTAGAPPASDSGGGAPLGLVIVLGVGTVLLAGLVGFAGITLARRL